MQISSNHPFLSTSGHVTEIIKPLNQLGINYFSYNRTYETGERIYLNSLPERLETYFLEKEYLIGNTEKHPKVYQNEILLWSTLPNQQLYQKFRDWNVGHGMFIIEVHKGYCEYFGLATSANNHQIINTYLTQLDYLKKFTSYFKTQAESIIQTAENNKILLPFNKGHHAMSISNIKLSKRQTECATLLINGHTGKEIASQMNLSVRTVDSYLENIKAKLYCRNKVELILKLSTLLNTNEKIE